MISFARWLQEHELRKVNYRPGARPKSPLTDPIGKNKPWMPGLPELQPLNPFKPKPPSAIFRAGKSCLHKPPKK